MGGRERRSRAEAATSGEADRRRIGGIYSVNRRLAEAAVRLALPPLVHFFFYFSPPLQLPQLLLPVRRLPLLLLRLSLSTNRHPARFPFVLCFCASSNPPAFDEGSSRLPPSLRAVGTNAQGGSRR